MVKVFPAGSLGPGYIKDIRGPLPQIELVPTGGINLNNAAEFIKAALRTDRNLDFAQGAGCGYRCRGSVTSRVPPGGRIAQLRRRRQGEYPACPVWGEGGSARTHGGLSVISVIERELLVFLGDVGGQGGEPIQDIEHFEITFQSGLQL